LSNVVDVISTSEKSGILEAQNKEERGKFYFRYGILAHGSISGEVSQLGNILLYRGILSEDELELVSKEHKTTGKPLGQISEEYGIASKEEIRFCMQLEAEDRLFEVLAWDSGTYSFMDKKMSSIENPALLKPTPELLEQDKQRIQSINKIRNIFPHEEFEISLKKISDDFSININLTALELKILALINQPAMIKYIRDKSPTDTLGTYRVLNDLLNCGLIEIKNKKKANIDFKAEEIQKYVGLFKLYFGIYQLIFPRFKESYNKGAWKALAAVFYKIKQNYPVIFDQIKLEAEGKLSSNTILGNVAKIDKLERERKCKQALNHYLLEQFILMKTVLGDLRIKNIYNHCIDYFDSEKNNQTSLFSNVKNDIESVFQLAMINPSSFEQGMHFMLQGNLERAREYLEQVPATSSDYGETQSLLDDMKSQAAPSEEPLPEIEDTRLVPIISKKLDFNKMQDLPYKSEEIYLLTRIDGTTDIKGLIAMNQVNKDATLNTIAKFIKDEHITLVDPKIIMEEIHKRVETVKLNEIELPVKEKQKTFPASGKHTESPSRSTQKIVEPKRETIESRRHKDSSPEPKIKETVKKAEGKSRKEIAREFYNNGMKLYNGRKYQKAVNAFEKAIENNPVNVIYYNMLNEAKSHARRSKGKDIYNQGINALKDNKHDAAIAFFKQAIALDKDDIRSLNKLIEIVASSPKYIKQAEKYIRKAIEQDFANPQNYVLLGRTLKENAKFKQAREAFDTALEWDHNCEAAKKELRYF